MKGLNVFPVEVSHTLHHTPLNKAIKRDDSLKYLLLMTSKASTRVFVKIPTYMHNGFILIKKSQ
jgi:hypothetical protein